MAEVLDRRCQDSELSLRFPEDTYSPIASIECGKGDWGPAFYVTLWMHDETRRTFISLDDEQQVLAIHSFETVSRVIKALVDLKDRLSYE